jgi:glucoamylase
MSSIASTGANADNGTNISAKAVTAAKTTKATKATGVTAAAKATKEARTTTATEAMPAKQNTTKSLQPSPVFERRTNQTTAPGFPGIQPSWSPGPKDLIVGTPDGHVVAAVGQGIVHEVFWPSVGRPQVRDIGFLVIGDGWWEEIKRSKNYELSVIDPKIPMATITHELPGGTFELEVIVDTNADALIIHYALTHPEPCTIVVLASPHLSGDGWHDNAIVEPGGLYAYDEHSAMALLASDGFRSASAGYVGFSDAWQDLSLNGEITWNYPDALDGNVAISGTLNAGQGTVVAAFATTMHQAKEVAAQTLAQKYGTLRQQFCAAWEQLPVGPSSSTRVPIVSATEENRNPGLAAACDISDTVLRVHMDHQNRGAVVASVATPWGAHALTGDENRGGYHLVWGRDCVETAMALFSLGRFDQVRDILCYLASCQRADGSWTQNWFPDGEPFWTGVQLDETALPVVLAAKMEEVGQLGNIRNVIRYMVCNAIRFLVSAGPVSPQDRWEENPGISPYTLAATIAALRGASALDFLTPLDSRLASSVANDWTSRIDDWLYVGGTELDIRYGTSGHYVRLNPSLNDARRGTVQIRNRDAVVRNTGDVVGMEFLALVRFGLRAANDPRIVDTLTICEGELGITIGEHRHYHRYEADGYGEHDDGSPFDGTGIGRAWPLLTAERAIQAVLSGEDERLYVASILASRTKGGMIPEQVWDRDAIDAYELHPGLPSGSAAPLVWAHSELLKIVAAKKTGRAMERLGCMVPDSFPLSNSTTLSMTPTAAHWRSDVPIAVLAPGKKLLIEAERAFTLHLGMNGWNEITDMASEPIGLGRFGVMLHLQPNWESIQFTRHWPDGTWEGQDHNIGTSSV